MGGGVDTAGDSLRAFIVLSTSWNGSTDDGCATFSSFLTCTGMAAFLKLGSFGFGFGAEKNDESDLASFTAAAAPGVFGLSLVSLTATGFAATLFETASFFCGGRGLTLGGSLGFRFFDLESARSRNVRLEAYSEKRAGVTHPLPSCYWRRSTSLLHSKRVGAISVRYSMPYP